MNECAKQWRGKDENRKLAKKSHPIRLLYEMSRSASRRDYLDTTVDKLLQYACLPHDRQTGRLADSHHKSKTRCIQLTPFPFLPYMVGRPLRI